MYVDGVEQKYAISSYSAERDNWPEIEKMFANVHYKSRA